MAKKTSAILIHDGSQWWWQDHSQAGEAPRAFKGTLEEPPEDLLQAVSEASLLRFLLAGEVRRLDIALPGGGPLPGRLRWAEVQALIAQETADLSGADPAGLLCAGKSYGLRKSGALLAGVFDRNRIEALHEHVSAAEFSFGGVASLELALLAAWSQRPTAATQALVLVGQRSTLVVPPGGGVATPIAGGLQHAALDGNSWLTRFTHGARSLTPSTPLRVWSLGEGAETLVTLLHETGGFADAQALPTAPLLNEAVALAVSARANNLAGALPLVNPYEPRKRFSHGWIVAPCVVLLALPFLYGWLEDFRLQQATKAYSEEAEQYLPLEKAIKDAQKKKESVQKALSAEEATQKALADRRRPLAAMVHMAYFFSRHAGYSLILESLEESGGTIVARGHFSDPEDYPRLNESLTAFCTETGLRVVRIAIEPGKDAEGLAVSAINLVIDTSGLGELK